jgi:hypothetical protein
LSDEDKKHTHTHKAEILQLTFLFDCNERFGFDTKVAEVSDIPKNDLITLVINKNLPRFIVRAVGIQHKSREGRAR